MVSEQGQASGPSTSGAVTGLARYFLSRLERLVQIRQTQSGQLSNEVIRILDRAIYTTLCDCIDAGAGEVARAILHNIAVPFRLAGESGEQSSVERRLSGGHGA